MLVDLLQSEGNNAEAVHRQASKALANLGVNAVNKEKVRETGGIPPLIHLAKSDNISVSVEAIAALANLAVNDTNEVEIARLGGLDPILEGAGSSHHDLQSQSARALRNLSVHHENKTAIIKLNGVQILRELVNDTGDDRIRLQASRALSNLQTEMDEEELYSHK